MFGTVSPDNVTVVNGDSVTLELALVALLNYDSLLLGESPISS